MRRVELHILTHNEAEILPYVLRHYRTFCQRITVHDAQSTDTTRSIAESFGAIVKDWRTDGVNDALAKELKEAAVRESRADWCITADADELIYFPRGATATLDAYDKAGLAVIKTRGFEMWDDVFPTGDGQLYDYVKRGSPDQKWYAKPILVAPPRIQELVFSAGAHTCWATLKDGSKWHDQEEPADPPTYMLHCHHIGGPERITRRYAGQQSRHSATNIKNRWGNFADPRVHMQEKRDQILDNLRQVIP